MELFHIKIFVLLDKICKLYKLFKIQGTGYYNINVTFISFPKDLYHSPNKLIVGGNRFSKKCCLGGWVISLFLGYDNKNLGASFEWRGAWVKMPRFNAFYRNVYAINLKIIPTHGGIYKCERKFNKHSGEKLSLNDFIDLWKDVSLRLILKDKGGNQQYLLLCWF